MDLTSRTGVLILPISALVDSLQSYKNQRLTVEYKKAREELFAGFFGKE